MATRIALIWEQFAPYHIDRIEAVGQRLAGRAEVVAVEVATTSQTYGWKPSGGIENARKLTLFPGESYERIHPLRRFWRQWRAVRGCSTVIIGVSYAHADIIIMSWLLRLSGRKPVMITDSKFEDRPRLASREFAKGLLLKAYRAVIVAGRRQRDFVTMLGFRRNNILPGCDTVGVERIRREAHSAGQTDYNRRDFICVARLVPKKNLFTLVAAYARYVELETGSPRRLVIAGSGDLAGPLAQHAAVLGVTQLVEFIGFVDAVEVSRRLASSLALLLLSREEQWGLVVNEAIALGLPVIVSHAVGSGDVLVRNLINGFLFEPDAIEGPARAMHLLATDQTLWLRMCAASTERIWLADSERFADAVEVLVAPENAVDARAHIARYEAVLAETA